MVVGTETGQCALDADELGIDRAALAAQAAALQGQGRTVSWLMSTAGGATPRVLGLLAFGDTIKPTAAGAVRALHAMGIRTVLVSGDNRGSAQAVAAALGIDDVRAEVLPQDKALVVAALHEFSPVVAMVGDGINDAPALAAADVGIAMANERRWHRRGDARCRRDADARRPGAGGRGDRAVAPHHREDPAEPVLGLCLQRDRGSAGGLRPAEPGARRRGHGLQQCQRGQQCAAAAATGETPLNRGNVGHHFAMI
jgi:magnesium-transporting ATPase (P-type)